MEPKYILQKNCETCHVITYLNAHIHKYGTSPLKYGSEEYKQFILKKCSGRVCVNGELELYNYRPILKLLKAKEIKHKCENKKQLREWFIEMWDQKLTIAASGYIKGLHSYLIADYNPRMDTFKCVNAGFYTRTQAVEWVPISVIFSSHYQYDQLEPRNISRSIDKPLGWNIASDAVAISL